jgi:spermidine synthase
MELTYTEIDHDDTRFGRLTLRRYDTDAGESGHEILLDGSFLMASHGSHSERAMAELAHSWLPENARKIRVLVGGLGAGHTLRAALDLAAIDTVEVAEIGAKVVDWNRRYYAEANGHAVDDPRVAVTVADVREVMTSAAEPYDLILLDVDNGPGWLASPSNTELYQRRGMTECALALTDRGVLAVWAPQPNRRLETVLEEVFPTWRAVTTAEAARRSGEPPSVVYLASASPPKN